MRTTAWRWPPLWRCLRPSHPASPAIPIPRARPGPRTLQSRNCSCSNAPGRRAPPPAKQSDDHAGRGLPPDHRTIATAQQLLITSPYSPGSPFFLPHGARIYNKLIDFLRAQYKIYGFEEVHSPTIYKRSLWETSGHWENYKEDMFEVTGRGASGVKDEGITEGQEEEYGLKPMNCPGHCLMFKATGAARSLRDLPVRYADFAPLHRNENSGSLSGLTRVRRFHQDDGHIFCRPSQIAEEISSTLNFIETVYKTFHLPSHKLVLSTRPDNYIGNLEEWDRAEAALRQALDASGQKWSLNEGDGAFYGPKIDVILKDSDGKQHQTATIQLDFQLPRRFGLEYLAPAPAAEQKGIVSEDPNELKESGLVTPVIIHRAILGSLERFMALLIEHYNGKWPFWLSPRQAIVVPVAMTDEILVYAREVRKVMSGISGAGGGVGELGAQPIGRRTFHVDVDESNNSLAKKVKLAKTNRYNHVIVVGERNVTAGTVSVDAEMASPHRCAKTTAAIADGQGHGANEQRKRDRPMEMTPAEVYDYFLAMEREYA